MDEMARRFCLLGCTDEELGRSFLVGESTVKRWMEEHPSFRASVKEGRSEADAQMASRLFTRGLGYEHTAEKIFMTRDGEIVRAEYQEHHPPDTAAAIFWLKNRRRDLWRDNPQVLIQNNANVSTAAAPGADPAAISQNYRSIVDGDE
jgi:hypothetical protein